MRWFELAPHVGVDPDGSPQPFVEEGIRLMTEERNEHGQWVPTQLVYRLRPAIPGSRVIAIDEQQHPALAAVIAEAHRWNEIDPPRSVRPRRPKQSHSPGRRR